MSDFLVGAALWLDLSTARKMVLVSLCENADKETGHCFPNQDYIAARCSLSERAVRGHLSALEGLYVRTLKIGHGYGGRTHRIVNVDLIEKQGRARHDAFQQSRREKRAVREGFGLLKDKAAESAGFQPEPFAGFNRHHVPVSTGSPASDDPSDEQSEEPSGTMEHLCVSNQ